MEQELGTYVSVLQDSLNSKYKILQKIYEATKKQEEIVSAPQIDVDGFDALLEEKEVLIHQMLELDHGFDSVYAKIRGELMHKKEQYKKQILQMQDLLRSITDFGVRIQALEQRNKQHFDDFVSRKRREIRDFQQSNQMANSYYQHMANQHQQWQSYFLDKKQ